MRVIPVHAGPLDIEAMTRRQLEAEVYQLRAALAAQRGPSTSTPDTREIAAEAWETAVEAIRRAALREAVDTVRLALPKPTFVERARAEYDAMEGLLRQTGPLFAFDVHGEPIQRPLPAGTTRPPMLSEVVNYLEQMTAESRGLDPDEVGLLAARLRTALYFETKL